MCVCAILKWIASPSRSWWWNTIAFLREKGRSTASNASVGIVLSPTGSIFDPKAAISMWGFFLTWDTYKYSKIETVQYWKPWFSGTPILGNLHCILSIHSKDSPKESKPLKRWRLDAAKNPDEKWRNLQWQVCLVVHPTDRFCGLVHPSYKWTLLPLIPFITRVN